MVFNAGHKRSYPITPSHTHIEHNSHNSAIFNKHQNHPNGDQSAYAYQGNLSDSGEAMSTLIWNLSYGLRALRKNLGLTAAVIATLTLGIGATTAIYTVVYATLLAPLPYPDPNQLILVWQRQNTSFQQLVAWTEGSFNMATADQPQQVDGRLTSPGWFHMQGIPFLMGRDFLPEEGVPGKNHVVVLTHKLWNRLGANRDIIGKTMRVNSADYT